MLSRTAIPSLAKSLLRYSFFVRYRKEGSLSYTSIHCWSRFGYFHLKFFRIRKW